MQHRIGSVKARLDDIDWKILAELQGDGRMTNVELARRVGISPPPCLRRVRTLEEAGYIRGFRAILDERELGYDVLGFVEVRLKSQSEVDLIAFETAVRRWDFVRECHMLSGEYDFIMKCVAPDLKSFQTFMISTITAQANVANSRSTLAIRASKSEAMVPFSAR
jgi:DNA-binding Lrp family transcriptional regulator